VILFQSEIKQVLEKVSPLRYLQSRRRDFSGVLADEIVSAWPSIWPMKKPVLSLF
jgi:hypothetical protein